MVDHRTSAAVTPEDLEITRHDGYIEVEFTGQFSVNAAMGVVDLMVAECLEAQRSAILLDCRGMSGPPSTLDEYTVAEYGAARIDHHIAVAMLVQEDLILPDRFFENVAVSRGVRVRQFADRGEAEGWLAERA